MFVILSLGDISSGVYKLVWRSTVQLADHKNVQWVRFLSNSFTWISIKNIRRKNRHCFRISPGSCVFLLKGGMGSPHKKNYHEQKNRRDCKQNNSPKSKINSVYTKINLWPFVEFKCKIIHCLQISLLCFDGSRGWPGKCLSFCRKRSGSVSSIRKKYLSDFFQK